MSVGSEQCVGAFFRSETEIQRICRHRLTRLFGPSLEGVLDNGRHNSPSPPLSRSGEILYIVSVFVAKKAHFHEGKTAPELVQST